MWASRLNSNSSSSSSSLLRWCFPLRRSELLPEEEGTQLGHLAGRRLRPAVLGFSSLSLYLLPYLISCGYLLFLFSKFGVG